MSIGVILAIQEYCVIVGVRIDQLCQNNGRCINNGNTHLCLCNKGYEGSYCEREINECSSAPCRNGATCRNEIGRYTCLCPVGYQVIIGFSLAY